MNLKNRLKKLEFKHSFEPKIMVVKFGNDIFRLSCGGKEFHRMNDESEHEFIERVKRIIEKIPNRALVTVLVGNF